VPPDASVVRNFLSHVGRRVWWTRAAEGAAAGVLVSVALEVAGWSARHSAWSAAFVVLTLVVVGAALRIALGTSGTSDRTAVLVERRAPQCRNVVLTANELIATNRADYMSTLVYRDAARVVGTLDVSELAPVRNVVVALTIVSGLWLLAVSHVALPALTSLSRPLASAIGLAGIRGIDVRVIPPAYTGRGTQSFHDPSRIEAFAGSSIRVTIHAAAASVALETIASRATLTPGNDGTFEYVLMADAEGYISVAPTTNGRAGVRRLIGLSIIPDAAPRVRITAPARDLFLRDSNHTIDLAMEATDDIGLASLRLRYTRVSGSGERFTFTEGDVPLTLTRRDARTWSARAAWPLAGLGLTQGDMVVYRAIATDNRPGAPPVESDSYIAEIVAPGGDAGPGFALDPEQERYAVSQQMVILRTERLLAKRASMTAESYTGSAQEIAAEQRKVRAEFVFMMGGELADAPDPNGSITDINETAEAEGEADLLAGRAANRGRMALVNAIRYMSRASTSLTTADLAAALPQERSALAQLEQAFSRTRILLRALTQREALDLSRRLTGTMTDAATDVRSSADPQMNPRVVALRRSLSGVATLAGEPAFGADASAEASALAVRVLQADPSSKALQEAAGRLTAAAADIGRGRSAEARVSLDRAATALSGVLRSGMNDAPAGSARPTDSRVSGALTDALRHRRRSGGTP
jgi:hypothetical protein